MSKLLSFFRNNITGVWIVVLFSMLLPIITIAGFDMPFVYVFTPLGILIMFLLKYQKINNPPIAKKINVIWYLIFTEIIISAIYSTLTRYNRFIFPTDIVQYIVRFIFFSSFLIIAYLGFVDAKKFIKYFMIILIIAMSIGILQWIPWVGRPLFISLYPYRDGALQLSQLDRPLHLLRMHGFAQHATANGGLACFSIVYAYSVFRYYGKYRFLSTVLIVLAIINMVASQARAGMLALGFAVLLFYIVHMIRSKNVLKSTVVFLCMLVLFFVITIILYYQGNVFVVRNVDRWINLLETEGGARASEQPQYFFSMMSGLDYIFGLSKPVINRSEVTYGVEIEPVNIFITYGLVGVIIQYLLIIALLVYFVKVIRNTQKDKTVFSLSVASFVSLFSYQVFSVAYFFFREIRVGLFPWILIGIAIGLNEKKKKGKIEFSVQASSEPNK